MDDKNQVYLTYKDGVFGWYCKVESELPGLMNERKSEAVDLKKAAPIDQNSRALDTKSF